MSKTKLTPEQKAYLQQIDSKKKRKKQKKEFKNNNFVSSYRKEPIIKHFILKNGKEQEINNPFDFGIDFEFDKPIIYKAGIKTENPLLTTDKLREITDPKNIFHDKNQKTVLECVLYLIKNTSNDIDLGSEIRRIFK